VRNGRYYILGRESVDILKVGGYKLSALDIERAILEHNGVISCAVVGIDDEQYGQVVGAVLVLRAVCKVALTHSLTHWLTGVLVFKGIEVDQVLQSLDQQLPKYQHPRRVLVLDQMPVNAMGKVNKKELVKLFNNDNSSDTSSSK
jgi:malonyl-CoA/methylmalonyl-CoA synthetase